MKELDEIKKRLADATPGPWSCEYSGLVNSINDANAIEICSIEDRPKTCAFISNAPTDIAKLITALEVACEALERQSYPHVEQFCKERAVDAIAKVKEVLK